MNRTMIFQLMNFAGSITIGMGIVLGVRYHAGWGVASLVIVAGIALAFPWFIPEITARRKLKRQRTLMLSMMRELNEMTRSGLLAHQGEDDR